MGNAVRRRHIDLPRKRRREREEEENKQDLSLARESLSVFFIALGLFLGLALYSHWSYLSQLTSATDYDPSRAGNLMGVIGAWASHFLVSLLGWCSFVTVVWALLLARRVWIGTSPVVSGSLVSTLTALLGSIVLVVSAATFVSVLVGYRGGGEIGSKIALFLIHYVNEPGTLLLSFFAFVISLGVATGVGTGKLFHFMQFLESLFRALLADTFYVVTRSIRSTTKFLFQGWFVWLRRVFAVVQRSVGTIFAPISFFQRLIRRHQNTDSAQSDTASDENIEIENEEPYVLEAEKSKRPGKVKVSRGEIRKQAFSHLRRSLHQGGKKTLAKSSKSKVQLPPLELLVPAERLHVKRPHDDELIKNSKRLEKTLRDFRIGGRITEVQPGPVITLYHFEPAAGVKVQKIVTLADDIALALKVASVRVYAPVPGKGTVGIEVPNAEREIVRLREVLSAPVMQNSEAVLELAIGKDTFGEPYVADLAKMPHLLIAGATGTGKSVCINAMLLSLLYRNTPETLRLIMIDPKMLELSVYEEIPHLLAPVVTNPKKAKGVLMWAVEEMDQRYCLMKALGVRNLASYNRAVISGDLEKAIKRMKERGEAEGIIALTENEVVSVGTQEQPLGRGMEDDLSLPKVALTGEEKPLPRIVIVVDELADLMLTVGREVEELLTRLAQKARASGIHLILATQRPSVNVITGLIKANFPARVSFQVASRIDARTVMDNSGAEKLLGQGDMLFLLPGTGRVRRLHSAYVSDKEVQDVTEWLKAQGPPDYDTDIEETVKKLEEAERHADGPGGDEEYDPLYDQAVSLVVDKGLASTSMIQRAFRIGYNRAARILESMEREGLVGPQDGARPREVRPSSR